MSRQHIRSLKLLPLLLLLPLFWKAHSTYTFERHLSSLQISLSDFPPSYADALSNATYSNAPTFSFDYSLFPLNTTTASIPPIIHFIWFPNLYNTTGNSIPHHGSNSPGRCELWDPHFQIWTWNASSAHAFLSKHYPSILATYARYPYPIQRVDALKYHLLHHYGGVYMDLDISCRRPLEPLMSGWPAWFPKAKPWGINNDLMAARPGHPLLAWMIGRLEARSRWWWGSEWVTVFWGTGPSFASDMLAEWVGLHSEVRKEGSDGMWRSLDLENCSVFSGWSLLTHITIDPNAFFILPEQFYSQDPGFTFFGHSPGGTWYGDDAKFVLWLLDRPGVIAIVVGTPVALYTGLVVRRRRRSVGWKSGKV